MDQCPLHLCANEVGLILGHSLSLPRRCCLYRPSKFLPRHAPGSVEANLTVPQADAGSLNPPVRCRAQPEGLSHNHEDWHTCSGHKIR